MEFEIIHTSLNPADAQLICSRLNAAGFDAEVLGELAAFVTDGYALTTGGVRIQVPTRQALEARAFLAAPPAAVSPES